MVKDWVDVLDEDIHKQIVRTTFGCTQLHQTTCNVLDFFRHIVQSVYLNKVIERRNVANSKMKVCTLK